MVRRHGHRPRRLVEVRAGDRRHLRQRDDLEAKAGKLSGRRRDFWNAQVALRVADRDQVVVADVGRDRSFRGEAPEPDPNQKIGQATPPP